METIIDILYTAHEVLAFGYQRAHKFRGIHDIVTMLTEVESLGQQFVLQFLDIIYAPYGDYRELAEVTVDDYRLSVCIAYDTDTATALKLVEIGFKFRTEISVFDIVY